MRQRMTSVLRRAILLVGVLVAVATPLFALVPSVSAAPDCTQEWKDKGFRYYTDSQRCELRRLQGSTPIGACPAGSTNDPSHLKDKGPYTDNDYQACVGKTEDVGAAGGSDALPTGKVCPLDAAQFIMTYNKQYNLCFIDPYPGGGCPIGTTLNPAVAKCGAAPINDPKAKADLPEGQSCGNPDSAYDKDKKACKAEPVNGKCNDKYKEKKIGEFCYANPVTGAATKEKKPDGCPIDEDADFRWAMCPVYFLMSGLTKTLDYFINEYMATGNKIFDKSEVVDDNGKPTGKTVSDSYHDAWAVFRNFGIALVVIAGLVMLASEAFGVPIVDAYTVRKVLPRLLVAIVGISISWELCKFLIGLFDDLGHAIGSTIYTSFGIEGGVDIAALIAGQLVLAGAAAGAALLLTAGGVLSLLGTLVVAMLVGAAVLILRQAVIVAAVILAPLAIAAYVLPNTSKFANFWWDTIWRMLALYPIATGLIALCKVLGKITMQNPGGANDTVNTAGIGNLIAIITGTLFFFAGYALLPLAFRLTGGLVATLGGMANDRSRGFFDNQKKYRAEKVAGSKSELASGSRFKGDGRVAGALNSTTRNVAGVRHAGFNPRQMRARMRAGMAQRSSGEVAEYAEKNAAFNQIKNNDDFLLAGLAGNMNDEDARSYLKSKVTDKGARIYDDATVDQAVAAIRDARRATSTGNFQTAAVMALPATGTAFGDLESGGAGEMHDLINKAAGSDRAKAASMLAAMRSGAMGAKRFDLAGGGFGAQLKVLEDQYQGKINAEQGTAQVVGDSLKGQGGGYVAGAKTTAVKHFAPAMLKQLEAAHAAAYAPGADAAAMDNFQRELATVAGRYDAMQGVSPENARVLAEGVLSKDLGGTTVQKLIEANRGNDAFVSMRREYGRGGAKEGQEQEQQIPGQGRLF